MERLKEEVFKRQEEIRRIEQEIKQTYADWKRHLKRSLRRQNPPMEPDQEAGKTTHSESCGPERQSDRNLKGLEIPSSREPLREEHSGVQKQFVISSPTELPSVSTAIGKVAAMSPPSFTGVIYSSTPFTPFYPPNSVQPVTSVVEQGLKFQQSPAATPMVSVESLTNQSSVLPFAAVIAPLPSTYAPTSTQHLPSVGAELSLCPPGTTNNFHYPLKTGSVPTLLPCSKE